ncbi:GntR family transcriptional regulator [Paenibacillus sp. NPDC058071]|uniref:GntR family transcriptional regulator n=1 Tax=Paenibacillus sp. NPDC058071 TaxID=3346326 RepID=UPI0036DD2979
MMQIRLNPDHELQLYKQLANQLIEMIATGELKNGDTLPSVRVMAADLGINLNTVSKSYHELESKGLIELRPKAKALIIGGIPREAEEGKLQQVEQALKPVMAEAYALGLEKEQITSLFQRILKQWNGGSL